MTAQRKTIGRTTSAKHREFEELLRRAALHAKTHPHTKSRTATNLPVVRRKRVKAA